jgi:DNA invertase Pin-like site-specific DNA recombinase
VSADGTANGDGAADSFLRSILDAASAYERELIRARTKAALKAKKERGERAGCVPFGFSVDDDGRLISEESEQRTLHLVNDLRGQGLTLRAIVTELEAQGIRSRSGKPLRLTQVSRIVSGLRERSGNMGK